VERIERRRRGRAAKRAAAEPQFMEGGGPALFRWECGPSGEIQWVEGAPRGPLVGRSIARPHDGNGDRVDNEVVRAFGVRAPFRDATMMIGGEGIVAGEWKISGVPAFEPADGRFAGYRGVALRELAATPAPADAASEMLSDPDSIRELVHEIKTPLNAIIGFAEIIDGQYLGPADRSYRERASDIVGQARLLLTAIDDLDFAAKVHSGTRSRKPKTHLGELVERMAPALRDEAAEREVRLDSPRTRRDVTARVELDLAERLIIRLAVAALEQAEAGERLRLSVDQTGGAARVLISRPAALGGVSDERLFGTANGQSESFSLRLARGLARIAGADLIANASSLALVFQRA
jgi:signal transduction histidine kinase